MSETEKVFDKSEDSVVEGAGCTWCGSEVGEGCSDLKHGVEVGAPTHAQRWYDYWNATHDTSYTVSRDPKRVRLDGAR